MQNRDTVPLTEDFHYCRRALCRVLGGTRQSLRLANEPARLGSFWLVRITSQLSSARYELKLAR
jgi:hypothetical protein